MAFLLRQPLVINRKGGGYTSLPLFIKNTAMKKYIVQESKYPVATEIHEPSYDLVNTDNPTERYMCAPNEFTLGESLNGSEFWLERREYMHEDSSFNGVFATKYPTKI